MEFLVFCIFIFVIGCWYQLMQILGDTTFQWQMQKELLWELQAIRKQLEDSNKHKLEVK